MKSVFRLCVLLVAIVFTLPAAAQTAENGAIGTFIEVEGIAFITHAGQKKTAAIDMPVYLGDAIETAAASRVNVVFIDDTEITLGENASLTVDEYVFDEDVSTGNKGRYSLLRGAFLFTSGLMTKNQNPDVVLETPYGSIGLRGTTVWGGEIDREYGVLVQEGEVTVTTNRARVRVPAGKGTNIRSRDSIPTFAAAWGQEKIGHATGMVALKRHAMVKERIAQRREKNRELRTKMRELRQQKMEKRGNLSPEKKQMEKKPGMRSDKDETKDRIDENRERLQNRREQYRNKTQNNERR